MDAVQGAEVVLTVPAQPEFVRAIRTVVTDVASHLPLTIDSVDDVRIAVGEACAYLAGLPEEPVEYRVLVATRDDGLEVLVSIEAPCPEGWPVAGFEKTFTWKVLSGLTDRVDFVALEDGPGIALFKRTIELKL
jgi:serine/threonine-protein kinase RsbW